MKKTYDRKVFKRKLPGRRIRVIIILLQTVVLVGFPLMMQANTQDSTRQKSYVIKGRVVDEKKEPMPGVTVRLDSTFLGCTTDKKGHFSFLLPRKTGKLIFSFVGYKTVKMDFNADKFLAVKMKEDVSTLDEVTIVAYGTQSRREVIGAMSTVKAEEIKDIPTPSLANLLQGRVPGMNVINATGAPGGGGISVTIRGFNSLSIEASRRGSEPLWVIDGIPMLSFTSPITGTNTVAEIDPNDIESVQVLKDAASASIYGSRAANGVILVTTKKGRLNERAKVNINVSRTFAFNPSLPDLTGGNKERHQRMEALKNLQQAYYDPETNTYRYVESYEESLRKGLHYNYFWNKGGGTSVAPYQDSLNKFYNNSTNMFDYFFRTAKVTDANLQLNGGTRQVSYNVGLGYYNEDGVLRNTGFSRIKLLSNFTIRPFENMEANLRFYLARTGRKRSSRLSSVSGFFSGMELEQIPDELMEFPTLYPGPGHPAFEETVKRFNSIIEKNESYRLRASFDLSYELIKGLQWRSSLSLDYSQQNHNLFTPSELDEYHESFSLGQIGCNLMLLNENLLTYKRRFGEDHAIDLLAGFSFQADEMNFNKGWGKRAPSDLIHYVSWRGNVFDVPDKRVLKDFMSSREKSTMVGLFGRINYNFRQKYLASFTLRRDASSKFGEKVRWGTFPSYAVGYAFSEEPFMDWSRNVLEYGKIRVSLGKSGRQFDQPYIAYGLLLPGDPFLGRPTVQPYLSEGLINRELTWEETQQWDAGIDLDFFNYRLGITFDYYYRYTDKLLYKVGLPGDYSGFLLQWQNAYAISNEGVELQVKWDIIRKSKWQWNMTFNIARNWNRLEKSTNGRDFWTENRYNNLNIIGKPLNGIYAFQTNGYYSDQKEVPYTYQSGRYTPLCVSTNQFYRPGNRVFVDTDGNGRIEADLPYADDRVYVGSPLPIAHGGITSALNWKGFDLNVLFNYVLGRHILNAGRGASVGTVLGISVKDIVKPVFADLTKVTFWEKTGDKSDFPRNSVEMGLKDFSTHIASNVQKVNFIKLKTMTVGYTLPETIKKKIGFGVRVFVSGENLFTWTNYTGPDPESVDMVSGIDNLSNYPLARRVTLGLTVNL